MSLYHNWNPSWIYSAGVDFTSSSTAKKEASVLIAARELDEALTSLEGGNRALDDYYVSNPAKLLGNEKRIEEAEGKINQVIDDAVFRLLSIKRNLSTNYRDVKNTQKKESK